MVTRLLTLKKVAPHAAEVHNTEAHVVSDSVKADDTHAVDSTHTEAHAVADSTNHVDVVAPAVADAHGNNHEAHKCRCSFS